MLEKDWLTAHWPDVVTLGVLPLVIWVAKRIVDRHDRRQLDRAETIRQHGERLDELEGDRVKRTDLEEVRESLTQQIANNQERTEDRLDRILLHLAGGGR